MKPDLPELAASRSGTELGSEPRQPVIVEVSESMCPCEPRNAGRDPSVSDEVRWAPGAVHVVIRSPASAVRRLLHSSVPECMSATSRSSGRDAERDGDRSSVGTFQGEIT